MHDPWQNDPDRTTRAWIPRLEWAVRTINAVPTGGSILTLAGKPAAHGPNPDRTTRRETPEPTGTVVERGVAFLNDARHEYVIVAWSDDTHTTYFREALR